MKQTLCILIVTALLLISGCSANDKQPQIVATTLPVYEFTQAICQNTTLSIGLLINQGVSCLHDYTLQVSQMRLLEGAETIVISGAGLELFLDSVLDERDCIIDAASGIATECSEHHHSHAHQHKNEHDHSTDPHIWLSPILAKQMAANIRDGLVAQYPQHAQIFDHNLSELVKQLDALHQYGQDSLKDLSCRKLITFHDGFSYFAECFDLVILEAIEEEPGSETSAKELINLITLVKEEALPAVFTEKNGSTASVQIICAETGISFFPLDMAMSDSYFNAMYHNIDVVKEALK